MVVTNEKLFDVGGVLQERPFKIRRLGHVGLALENFEAGLRFYRQLLGLRISDYIDRATRVPPGTFDGMGDTKTYFMRYAGDHRDFVLQTLISSSYPLSASSYALYWRQTEAVARRNIAMIVGNGDYRYRAIADWAKLPEGWSFKEVGGVGVDSKDNVYVFNRGEHPMMIFDREGNFLRSWGEGQYPRAHGVHVAPDDTMFLTDDGGHFVRKVTLGGKVLLELGVPGKPAPFMSGEPFHRCTHTALSPKGEIYVSDGYGNSRVHKYSPDGKLLMSWGAPGTGEGEFNIVHNICCDADGWVYVADRENHRVQVFDGNGKFETQWQNLHRPCGLCMPYGHKPIFYVGEVGPAAAVSRDIPNLGPRVSIVDHQGKLIGRFGETPAGTELGRFLAPHGLAVDSHGDVYVGEVSWTAWPQIYPDTPRPDHIRSLQKFEKVG